MAWARPRQATTATRWSCKRCYTVNAMGAQFCSDCGLAPQGGTSRSLRRQSPPAGDSWRSRSRSSPSRLSSSVAVSSIH